MGLPFILLKKTPKDISKRPAQLQHWWLIGWIAFYHICMKYIVKS